MSGEELKWCQPANHKLCSQYFSPQSTAKTIIKHSPQEEWSLVVVIASVHSEKTRLKELMMMMMKMNIIIMNKLQETTVSSGRQKLTSAMMLYTVKSS